MFVIKRKGNRENVNFDKIHTRIKYLVQEPYELKSVNPSQLTQKVIQNIFDGISTSEIDNYTANLSASLSIENMEYGKLAGRIVVNNCHKNTLSGFKDKMNILYTRTDSDGKCCPLISSDLYKFTEKNQDIIESKIDYKRDYLFDFFGFRTFEKGYLLKVNDTIIERPQDLFMRVAISVHIDPENYKSLVVLDRIFETYELMSLKYFVHATPTLFNAGTSNQALASCFLLGTDDSLAGIMETATKCANISKLAGGIGFHCSNWRNDGALIRSTNGKSGGIVPFLRIFNDIARAFNQGGKRLGSFAAYLEPHHPDIMAFLQLRKNHGDENLRTRDLFLALWIPDLFMKRIKDDLEWSTFNPDECKGLTDCYGDDYEKLYLSYEKAGKAVIKYRARDIWSAIFHSQKESGLPYLLYKDNVNKYNNQANMGIIKSSNLCCEITIYSDAQEFGTCVLGSICLSNFVTCAETQNNEFPKNPVFNYKELARVAGVLCRNLDNIIDKNLYPCEEAKRSSMRGRPIGIGVQGLADVFYKFKIPFDSAEAKKMNKIIFEAIYYGAVSMSTKISKAKGAYPAYLENKGSPMSNGLFTWELYGLKQSDLSGMFDWETVREHVKLFGVRNSLLTALMPTASTSQINGNVECFEPLTSNMYKRKVLSGEFIVINKYLVNDLQAMNLWDDKMINYLKVNSGSIQGIDGLPESFKSIYKNVWEIPQKVIIDLCIDRQPFVDQSQSMNLFFQDYTYDKFSASQFYAWSNKLKTGSYYIRTQASVMPQKFTVNPGDIESMKTFSVQQDDAEICLLCSA
jgi:ribonucleoside-diphosphate reductase alpha chain